MGLNDIPPVVWTAVGAIVLEAIRRVFSKEYAVTAESRQIRVELREENKQLRVELEALKVARDTLHNELLALKGENITLRTQATKEEKK